VADLEVLRRTRPTSKKIAYPHSVVEARLRDLKTTFDPDPDHARRLGGLVGQITLRREGPRLVVELQGNLAGLLERENQVGNRGAGREILFERQTRVRVAAPLADGRQHARPRAR
jgi:hypothetical protein